MLSLPRRSNLRHSVAFVALIAAGAISGTAQAQTRNFNLQSQDAVRAIPEFARQAGIQILAPADGIDGLLLPSLHGQYDIRKALGQLLKDTQLEIVSDDGLVITLRVRRQHAAIETVTPVAAPAGTSVVSAAAPAPAPQEQVMDEIVVTGSRIVRDGFEAPTPLTVVGTEEIAAASRVNIADFVSTLPSFSGAVSPHGGNQTSDGRQGQSNLSTRGLGATRTLVLLDSHRVGSSDINGTTNISDLPQALVARVDVVTGGASAAYGSDALAGVVNFILDKEFTGVKGDIAGSVSTYGDNRSFKGALSFGTQFANGRGHLLVSGDIADTPGFNGDKREWNRQGWRLMSNPAYVAGNGQPQFIIRDKVGLSNGAPGGLIVSGPLKGVYWGPGGAPSQLNWGAVAGTFMVGGDWKVTDASQYVSIENDVRRKSLYIRASYEITESVEFYAQYIFGNSNAAATTAPHFNLSNITIQATNPFLSPALAAQMTAMSVTSFVMGSLHADLPGVHSDGLGTVVDRRLYSYSGGFTGTFEAAGSEWNWDLFMARDLARSDTVAFTTILPRVTQASDAARNPTTGAIVCRSTLTNPGDGCVPYNPMGIGMNSAAAIDWITGESTLYRRIKQQAYAASASGEPFDLWAGPVSLAFGLEHRKTSAAGAADALSLARVYQVGNFQPTFGGISVTEGFIETVVPLAMNTAWAESLEFNAAVRGTDYSTSGYVTTWKAGFTYRPNTEIMFRGTRSRDIRAPNIEELYYAYGFDLDGRVGPQSFADPETKQAGVDNELFRVLGCIEPMRGTINNRPSFWTFIWTSMKDTTPAWLVTVTGPDLDNDGPVTVTFDRSMDHLKFNGTGEARHDVTYRIDPDPRSHHEFKGEIKDGVISITEHKDLKMLQDPLSTPEFILSNTHLRLKVLPDGALDGFIGGYQPWETIYWSFAQGGIDAEQTITGELPGIYHLLRRFADAAPDAKGQNTRISATYRVEFVPAFAVPAGTADLRAQAE